MPVPITKETAFQPLCGNSFKFRCDKDLVCFTRCCADLRLPLTPYDILRMKNRLNLPSHDFLEVYTHTRFEPKMRFPQVVLAMREDEPRSCPFVTSEGCIIYQDRPGACRIYPLGRASLSVGGARPIRENFFLVREEHCFGFREDRTWTIEEWMAGEGLGDYNTMNDLWQEILSYPKGLGPEKEISRKIQMFFMVSYNLDRFREFIFNSRFLQLFDVASLLRETLISDDIELLRFGFRWLKFSLYGENTMQMKS